MLAQTFNADLLFFLEITPFLTPQTFLSFFSAVVALSPIFIKFLYSFSLTDAPVVMAFVVFFSVDIEPGVIPTLDERMMFSVMPKINIIATVFLIMRIIVPIRFWSRPETGFGLGETGFGLACGLIKSPLQRSLFAALQQFVLAWLGSGYDIQTSVHICQLKIIAGVCELVGGIGAGQAFISINCPPSMML